MSAASWLPACLQLPLPVEEGQVVVDRRRLLLLLPARREVQQPQQGAARGVGSRLARVCHVLLSHQTPALAGQREGGDVAD